MSDANKTIFPPAYLYEPKRCDYINLFTE